MIAGDYEFEIHGAGICNDLDATDLGNYPTAPEMSPHHASTPVRGDPAMLACVSEVTQIQETIMGDPAMPAPENPPRRSGRERNQCE